MENSRTMISRGGLSGVKNSPAEGDMDFLLLVTFFSGFLVQS